MNEQTIDQSEDFVGFTINDQRVEFDLYEAHDTLVKIDLRHKDDPWRCLKCFAEFPKDLSDQSNKCPACEAEPTVEQPAAVIARDDAYLEDIIVYLKSKGFERVSRKTAAMFYVAILDVTEAIKKKESLTLESLTGTESTPPTGPADGSGFI